MSLCNRMDYIACEGSDVIPSYADLCASFQHAVCMHLCKKIQRGMVFTQMRHLLPPSRQILVVSGGVACNDYIKRGLELVCEDMGFRLVVPPKPLCVDNGVMIAWNGVEKWNVGSQIIPYHDLQSVDIEAK